MTHESQQSGRSTQRTRRRTYKNVCEEKFAQLAERRGWKPVKRGWPDFICFGDGEIFAVEVKPRHKSNPNRMDILKREQADAMDFLSAAGIRCFVSDGDEIYPYDRERHAPETRRRKRIPREPLGRGK